MPNRSAIVKEPSPSLSAWQTISDAFAFLAAILNNQPSEEMLAELRRRFSGTGSPLHHGSDSYRLIAQYLSHNRSQPAAALVQELSVEWTRLFRGISPVYGPQPPYAGVYNSGDGVGVNTLMALTQMYTAYGLEVRSDNPNRADYLGAQLDFISILAQRVAQEAARGNSAGEAQIRSDIVNLLQQHILPWLPTFVHKAMAYAQTDFFTGYLTMLDQSLSELEEALVSPSP